MAGYESDGDSALHRFHHAIADVDDPGMVASDTFDGFLSLYWCDNPIAEVNKLIAEARAAGVAVEVIQCPWSDFELHEARERINADAALMRELKVSLLGFARGASGLRVGIAGASDATDLAGARARIQAAAGAIPVFVIRADPTAF